MNLKSTLFAWILLFLLFHCNIVSSKENILVFSADRLDPLIHPGYAALAQKTMFNFSFSNLYIFKEIKDVSASIVLPYKHSGIALSCTRFGNDVYKNNYSEIALSHSIFKGSSLGLKAIYNSVSIKQYGNQHNYHLDFSFYSPINKFLSSGVLIASLFESYKADKTAKDIRFVWGLQYKADKHVNVLLELEKSILNRTAIKTGIVYTCDSSLQFRMYLTNHFKELSFGIQFGKKRFTYAIRTTLHYQLGLSNHLLLSYAIKD